MVPMRWFRRTVHDVIGAQRIVLRPEVHTACQAASAMD
jgi:hypothetical protein